MEEEKRERGIGVVIMMMGSLIRLPFSSTLTAAADLALGTLDLSFSFFLIATSAHDG